MEVPAYYSPPSPAPRISEWFTESFTLFGREWKTWTLQGLLYLVLQFLPALPVLVWYFSSLARILDNLTASGPTPSPALPPMSEWLTAIGIVTASGCLSTLVGVFLLAGMTRTAAKQLRGEPISVGDLFSAGEVLLPDLGAYLLGSLALSVAFSLCFIPGLLLMGLWLFVHPLIVEGRVSLLDSFRQSWSITKPHLAMYILWAVLIFIVLYAGSMIGIGIVVTLPISMLMWVISYRDVVGLPGALPPTVTRTAGIPATAYDSSWVAPGASLCPACRRPVAPGAVNCAACGTLLPPGSSGTR